MLIINLQGSEAFQIRTKPLLIKLYIFLRVFCFVNHQHFNQPYGVNGSFADLDLTAMHKDNNFVLSLAKCKQEYNLQEDFL